MVFVIEVAIFLKGLVLQVINHCIAVSVAVKGQPSLLFTSFHAGGLTGVHDLLAHAETRRTAQTLVTIHVMTDDQIAVVRQHRCEVRCELILLPFDTVELLVGEVKRIVFEVQQWGSVGRAIHRTTTLERHFAGIRIIQHLFHYDQHAAFNLLCLRKGHICPAVLIHILLNTLLQGLVYLFVRTLYLVGVNGHGAIQFLRTGRNEPQTAKPQDDISQIINHKSKITNHKYQLFCN